MQLIIRPNSVREEFDYILYLLKNLDFYNKNNYFVSLPDRPEFKHLTKDSPALFSTFSNDIYRSEYYHVGLNALSQIKPTIEKVFPVFEQWHRQWEFKIFPKYEILLTRYGPGGSYDETTGIVTMLVYENGAFKRQNQSPAETIVHEMVHIGIQELIVDPFKLTHWEKERLVDLICKIKLKSVIPNYQMQQIDNTHLEEYINEKAMENLPLVIEKFVADFPRQ